MSAVAIRQARSAELAAVTQIFAVGFSQDPVWGEWTFPDLADRVSLLQEFWRPYVVAAAKYDGVIVTENLSAVALWVPPDTADLDEEDEAEVEQMLPRVCGSRASLLEAGWEAFGRSRPESSHWYLSLLATDPASRGRGAGMGLVARHLERVDADGLPAYLESTNTRNVDRYERAGFRLDGYFDLPEGPRVDRMWRDGR
jgi:ribosomal protein S18 acetylase RimI-like enzyme